MTIKTLEIIHSALKKDLQHAKELLAEARDQKDTLYDYMDDVDVIVSTQYEAYKLALDHYNDLLDALRELESKEW